MFKTTKLAGHRVLVQGSEKDQTCILDSSEWDEVLATLTATVAAEAYDSAIERFFAPITRAADKLDAALAKAMGPVDSRSQIVINPGVEAVEAVESEIIELGRDATILRMIESDHTEQLIWVGSSIELLQLEENEPEDEDPETISGAVLLDPESSLDFLTAMFGMVDEAADLVTQAEDAEDAEDIENTENTEDTES